MATQELKIVRILLVGDRKSVAAWLRNYSMQVIGSCAEMPKKNEGKGFFGGGEGACWLELYNCLAWDMKESIFIYSAC